MDIFQRVERKFGFVLGGFRHVEKRGNVVVVRSQLADTGGGPDDVHVFKVFSDGDIIHAGVEPAFAE